MRTGCVGGNRGRGALAGCLFAALVLAVLLGSKAWAQEADASPRVVYLTLDDQVVNPVEARFIASGLRRAQASQAQCLVIQLDTPGGLMASTRRIVKDILESEVPVVVYVAPRGARAGSAGVFLTLAAHVAVMAPGTNIGAAHPIALGDSRPLPAPDPDGAKGDQKNVIRDPLSDKVVQDAAAWARALAQYRGRNADWAARAVTESLSTPAEEAHRQHVIDFIAADRAALLADLDGRTVTLPERTVVLRTRGAVVHELTMSWPERLLDLLAHPTLAYLLLLVGFFGVLFEITHPGLWAPGVVGLICLILALFALQLLPVNYAGLALLGLGVLLLGLEVKVHSLGLLGLAGLGCLMLGSAMLIDPIPGVGGVSWVVIGPVSTAAAVIVLFLVGNVVRSHRVGSQTGMAALLGAVGTAQEDMDDQGMVFVHGELWRARTDQPVRAGDAVRVQGYEGLTLFVTRADLSTSAVGSGHETRITE